MHHEEGYFPAPDGLRLFFQGWRPKATARAAVLVVHGFGEHSGRYGHLAGYLVPQGFAVYALDHRGHGRSPGQRGHILRWSQYRADLERFQQEVAAWESGKPLFLYGHSMGSLIVLDYLLTQPSSLRGAIVSGVLLEPGQTAKPLLVALARLFSQLWPSFSLKLGLDPQALSRHEAVVQAYRTDPLVHGQASARWGTEVLRIIQAVKARAQDIRTPLLILHGEADTINRVEGARWLWQKVATPDKVLRVYPGGFHEPHNDLNQAQVLQDVAAWLEQHL